MKRLQLVPVVFAAVFVLLAACSGSSGGTAESSGGSSNPSSGGKSQSGGSTATNAGGSSGVSGGNGNTANGGGVGTNGGAVGAAGASLTSGGANSAGNGGSNGGASSATNGGTIGASGASTNGGGSATGGANSAGASNGGAASLESGCGDLAGPTTLASTSTQIDFDMSGRSQGEVLEPGWAEWIVAEAASDTKTFNGITFKLAKSGAAGTGLEPTWYKAGVGAPNYARLVGDGVTVTDGSAGGAIALTITGLSAGKHTLLAYHNTPDGNVWAPLNVEVDGAQKLSNVQPSNRALSTDTAASSYVTLDVTAGKAVNVVYSPSTGTGTKNVILNAIALDVPNPVLQAKSASPGDRDWHVDAASGSLALSWSAGKNATSHNVYFGTDAKAVSDATTTSSQFKGTQAGTSYKLSGLTNLRYYYWRVDEVDSGGAVIRGNRWSFSPRHLAFPGAEGYGRFARGGRCGKVVHVTNLNDAGAGSLREAVEKDIGPRTIVFDVGGLITLSGRLTMASNFVTVAGQTAPGKGITIRSAPFGFSGVSDGTMRFVRVRVGYGPTYDGIGLQGSDHSIFDHNSVSWSSDEAFSSRNAKNITLQRTLIAESLNAADHTNSSGEVNQRHGFAATISGNLGSFHHNLSVHNEGRNFSMGAAIDGAGTFVSRLDLFNNVVYNFGGRANDGQAHQVNFVNNYYKKGAATRIDFTFSMDFENYGTGTLQAYYAGNILQNANGTFSCDGKNNACGRRYTLTNGNPEPTWNVFPSTPFFPSYATIQTAAEAYKSVLSDVGASMPVFDDHDQRMVKETLAGSYMYKGSVTGFPGLIDREADAGGFESYPQTTRAADFDSDSDGLPDWYETQIGTNAKSASGSFADSNADANGDGYTNLEEYLEWMATPHADVKTAASTTFDLATMFRGYTKSPTYKAGTHACLTAAISGSKLTVTPKSACGIAYLPVTVTDSEGGSMTRSVGIFATP